MTKLLHVIASPRGDKSRSLKIGRAVLERFAEQHPDGEVDEINLFEEKLPTITEIVARGKYALLGGGELEGEAEKAWRPVIAHIERFKAADIYLISAPMWNFSIPYALKQYIDALVQPNFLFRYTESGPEGLLKGRRMIVATSRGGDYGPESPFSAMDNMAPYLRTIFGFCGVAPIDFVIAQPMDSGDAELRDRRLAEAVEQARRLAI